MQIVPNIKIDDLFSTGFKQPKACELQYHSQWKPLAAPHVQKLFLN